MTDAASPTVLRPELQAWVDAWKTSAQNVLSQVSGQPSVLELVREPFAAADSDLRYTIVAAGAVQGEMALCLSQFSAIRLAHKFLGEAEAPVPAEGAVPEAITNDSREALEELFRQIAGLTASAVAPAAGGEVKFQLSRTEAPWAWTSDAVACFRMGDTAGGDVGIEIRISPALAAALAARATGAVVAPAAASTTTANPAVAAVLNPPSQGYRRLLDVGLGVSFASERVACCCATCSR